MPYSPGYLTPHLAIGGIEPQSLLNGHQTRRIVPQVVNLPSIAIVKGVGSFVIALIHPEVQGEFDALARRDIGVIEIIPIIPVLRLNSYGHACKRKKE